MSAEDLINAVATAAHVQPEHVVGRRDKVRLLLRDRYLKDVAKLDEVQSIFPVVPKKLFNNVARNIMMGHGDVTDEHDFEKEGVKILGETEIVAVADTGIDDMHPAFKDRIVGKFAWGRPETSSRLEKTDDPVGHGTHVSGSVLGNGEYDAGNGTTVKVKGTAPKAKLIMQSTVDDDKALTGIPSNLDKLFSQAYENGAKVHNNSWGAEVPALPYGVSGSQIDKFVRKNADMVICFAAGNDGIDKDRNGVVDFKQIGSEAAAKNCITVGASESYRPEGGLKYGRFRQERTGFVRFATNPLKPDGTANNSSGMAAFSSRGPSKEGRVKPDIVAPGTCILSARSSIAEWGQDWAQSKDEKWMFDGGTSMACPLVAGGCALIREALKTHPLNKKYNEEHEGKEPSAALVKALLINGAEELKGQYLPTEAGPSPNFSSGWGRVNLTKSLETATYAESPAANGCHDGDALDDDNNKDYSREVEIADSGKSLKVTLVWTDLPGAMLQNDLDLTVSVSGPQTKLGNSTVNRTNNVEQVVWPNIPEGKATILVHVKRLTRDTQSFALAWSTY